VKSPWSYEQIEELIGFLKGHSVHTFEYEAKGVKISLGVDLGTTPSSSKSAASKSVQAALPVVEENPNLKKITSPFVGTFYAAPSPTSPAYIKEGQHVKKGDVLCILEAMKLMNEIEAEQTGTIRSILVENGQPVEYGQPLFLIETDGR